MIFIILSIYRYMFCYIRFFFFLIFFKGGPENNKDIFNELHSFPQK